MDVLPGLRRGPPEAQYARDEPVSVSPPDGFADWYEHSHWRLVPTLVLITGDLSLAREAADEACARALARWATVEAIASPVTMSSGRAGVLVEDHPGGARPGARAEPQERALVHLRTRRTGPI